LGISIFIVYRGQRGCADAIAIIGKIPLGIDSDDGITGPLRQAQDIAFGEFLETRISTLYPLYLLLQRIQCDKLAL
jgi:hypothetical protein